MDVLRAGEEAEAAGTGAEATAHRVAARRRSCSEPVRLGARGVLGRRGRQWRSGPAGASSARAFLSPFCTECRDRITELATAKLAPSVKCIAPFLLLSLSSWHLIGHNVGAALNSRPLPTVIVFFVRTVAQLQYHKSGPQPTEPTSLIL